MNILWSSMLLLGIAYGALQGRMPEVTDGVIQASREAVVLAVSLVGVTGFWAGLMEIAKKAGVIDGLVKRMGPVMRFLFPEVPEDHPAMRAAGMNMICNVFGLGAAATPPGLVAMEQFEKLEEQRREEQKRSGGSGTDMAGKKNPAAVPEGTANREMCTFLILNISSLQLIPINIIAYRSQYGSVNPAGIVGAGIVATLVSTVVGVAFAMAMGKRKRV